MITGTALILVAVYVTMPKAIMITLCTFGAIKAFFDFVALICKITKEYLEG